MSWFYQNLARPLLFSQDSERIHDHTLDGLAWASRCGPLCQLVEGLADVPTLPVNVMGLTFPNPLGLAAGMDKQARAVPIWKSMGFGFSELGGVTWHAQPGNPQPRMFRAVAESALINRMGFNNGGAPVLAVRLAEWRSRGQWPAHPVGINLGKSKITPLTEASSDYAQSFRALWDLADFFVVNVSSPNTPNLRQLQDKSALDEILAALQVTNARLARDKGAAPKPVLVKVAPDLSWDALDEIVELVAPRQLAGLVATNTTIARPPTNDPVAQWVYQETGGLSGAPLRQRSTEVIRHLYRQTQGQIPIIGVGGISCVESAWEKITAGASLIQIYSGLVYQGPGLVRDIVQGIRERLGGANWKDAVGSGKAV
ncbi:MAG TPA: quinone-dependent dihydroorotate dehydrogenase [Candidatus Limnocylindria bacterium]|jgi:dihydroorotate dehydrogenase|nr:quinone-dependent dihydroorotate dehydrogenase [Candidatus Limnocylindria bacterium]